VRDDRDVFSGSSAGSRFNILEDYQGDADIQLGTRRVTGLQEGRSSLGSRLVESTDDDTDPYEPSDTQPSSNQSSDDRMQVDDYAPPAPKPAKRRKKAQSKRKRKAAPPPTATSLGKQRAVEGGEDDNTRHDKRRRVSSAPLSDDQTISIEHNLRPTKPLPKSRATVNKSYPQQAHTDDDVGDDEKEDDDTGLATPKPRQPFATARPASKQRVEGASRHSKHGSTHGSTPVPSFLSRHRVTVEDEEDDESPRRPLPKHRVLDNNNEGAILDEQDDDEDSLATPMPRRTFTTTRPASKQHSETTRNHSKHRSMDLTMPGPSTVTRHRVTVDEEEDQDSPSRPLPKHQVLDKDHEGAVLEEVDPVEVVARSLADGCTEDTVNGLTFVLRRLAATAEACAESASRSDNDDESDEEAEVINNHKVGRWSKHDLKTADEVRAFAVQKAKEIGRPVNSLVRKAR
jgi:hypothetical protein